MSTVKRALLSVSDKSGVVEFARGLAGRGHHVTVAVYNDQDHFAGGIRDAGIEIVRLAKPFRWSPKPIIGLVRVYRRSRADVVVAFLRSPAVKAEMARMLSGRMRVIAAERSVYPEGRLPFTLRATQSASKLATVPPEVRWPHCFSTS